MTTPKSEIDKKSLIKHVENLKPFLTNDLKKSLIIVSHKKATYHVTYVREYGTLIHCAENLIQSLKTNIIDKLKNALKNDQIVQIRNILKKIYQKTNNKYILNLMYEVGIDL